MIQAFVGLVGGGKSYCSTRRMMSYMALGGRVCSNIRLVGYDDKLGDLSETSPVRDYLRSIGWEYQARQYVYISYDEMCDNPQWFEKIPAGQSRDKRTLCVVDEATDLFDTLDGGRLRNDSGYRALFHFLRLSRHAHIDVLFICQDLNSINSRLRGLVANVWRSTDMRNFRLCTLKIAFPFDVFMLQLFDRQGRNELKREWVRKDSRIFGLYESETFGGCLGVKWDGVSVTENKLEKKGKKKMGKFWSTVVILSLLLQGVILYKLFGSAIAPVAQSVVVSGLCTNDVYCIVSSVVSNSLRSIKSPVSQEKKSEKNKPVTLRGSYSWHTCGNENRWIDFDGDTFKIGCPSEFGRMIVCEEYYSVFVDDDGNITYLCPGETQEEKKLRHTRGVAVALPSVSVQATNGHRATARPNLVSNTTLSRIDESSTDNSVYVPMYPEVKAPAY